MQLQVSYTLALHKVEIEKWERNCLIDMNMTIPLSGNMGVIEVPIFSYPKFSIEHNQVEFCTLDYMHILTNIHGHILKHGYDFCKQEHYREFADNCPDPLSSAFVYDVIDQHCVAKAMQMFDRDIEDYFRSKCSANLPILCILFENGTVFVISMDCQQISG